MNTDLLESRNAVTLDRCQEARDYSVPPDYWFPDEAADEFSDEHIACFARAFSDPCEHAREFLIESGITDAPDAAVCDVLQKLAELRYRRPVGSFPSDLYETFDDLMETWARADYDKRVKEEEE